MFGGVQHGRVRSGCAMGSLCVCCFVLQCLGIYAGIVLLYAMHVYILQDEESKLGLEGRPSLVASCPF